MFWLNLTLFGLIPHNPIAPQFSKTFFSDRFLKTKVKRFPCWNSRSNGKQFRCFAINCLATPHPIIIERLIWGAGVRINISSFWIRYKIITKYPVTSFKEGKEKRKGKYLLPLSFSRCFPLLFSLSIFNDVT